jgi:hypothetical protein
MAGFSFPHWLSHGRSLLIVALQDAAYGLGPVWRKVLKYHLNHSNFAVAQHAAAALAE